MEKYDSRIDIYIGQAADFAQPILKRIRALAHEACPEIIEAMKCGVSFILTIKEPSAVWLLSKTTALLAFGKAH
ncbi:hypothetical protein [Pedobacter sp. PACM 27299]|uniref:hypothetical protein n=1 Tax=Pedobacter sp. PACM 27299 TaxID=1727164 RepID=UPI000A58A0EF|nr:hypothetical protein [Pedobacter sp. PACM 27299]